MTLQDECRLSFYEDAWMLSKEHNVCLVRHIETGRLYVRKVLSAYNLQVYSYLKEHPIANVPRIYELVEDEGTLIVVEEYVQGETLENILKQQGKLSDERIADIFRQLCNIVLNLHSATVPIIHRDIKPSNIIITDAQEVKLLDMNAAHLSLPGRMEDTVLMGTCGYAAPEQYGFGHSDVRTDIYALGKLLEQMCEGNDRYKKIIQKATRLDPDKRYRNVGELIKAFRFEEHKRKYWKVEMLLLGVICILAILGMIFQKGKNPNTRGKQIVQLPDTEMENVNVTMKTDDEENKIQDTEETLDSGDKERPLGNDTESVSENLDLIPVEDVNASASVPENSMSDSEEKNPMEKTAEVSENALPEPTPISEPTPEPSLVPTATPTPTPTPTVQVLPDTMMINGVEAKKYYYEGFYFYIPSYYVNWGQYPDSNDVQFMTEGNTLRFSDLGAHTATLALRSTNEFYGYGYTYPNAQQAVEMSLRSGFLIVYRKLAECTNMEIAGYPATKVTIIGDQGSELSNLATSKIHIYDVENQRTIVFGIFLRTEDEMAFKYDYDELLKYIYHE
ncbi:MAG: serine/threonine protein kinase [Lachnospiraceae bacterium]|nr:serine/threonine protein kinase [Lachnospiraceae bacterium]